MNRGIAKRSVFEHREDVRYFLSLVARMARAGEIELLAYTILTTHFHLLLRSPRRKLSKAMGWVEQCFVQRFNRRRDRDGPLFRGRFLSRPVETNRYWRVLIQYIDHNPVGAGLVDHAIRYPWGSRRHYGAKSGPRWLRRDSVEAEVCAQAQARDYDPRDYSKAFPARLSEGAGWVVERRLRHSETGDIGEVDLIRAAPERVLRGLAARARLADGGPLGTPVASPDDIFHALASVVAAPWSVRASRKRVDGSAVLRVGLLRSACGLT
jgi:REP element-mobilizing transposase RayT